MTYVVSDLHGCFSKFQQLLKTIHFGDRDVMYVLGDMVDYGEEPMELLCDLSMRYNVIPILGEHDYRAYRLLTALDGMLKGEASADPEILVLDDGTLAGQGSHEELLENCAVYQEIYYSQFPREVKSHG